MMIFSTSLATACMAWAASAATSSIPPVPAPTNPADNPLAPPPPSKDPWYVAPAGYESAAPGDILRVREAPGLVKAVVNSSVAYNILYRTTDGNYQPSWAVTTLYVPQGANSSNFTTNGTAQAPSTALWSTLLAYDSASVDMSPSYTSYGYPIDPTITNALGQGWYVNVPDYEGPLASFFNGVQAGHAVIDSVRAVLKPGFGLRPSSRNVIFGYSGGAIAGEWAAELQVQYAPELNISAIAIGGTVPNVTHPITDSNNSPFATDAVNALLGLTSQNSAAQQLLMSQLKTSGPYNASTFLLAKTANTTVDAAIYSNQNIFNYFNNFTAFLSDPIIQNIIDTKATGGYHGVPASPMYIYKAVGDEAAPIADTDALVERFCGVGANILYQRNSIGGHLAGYYNMMPTAMPFLAAALDGTFAQKYQTYGCTVQNTSIAFDSSPE